MKCVYCGFSTRVTNSRWQKRNNQIWRRRQCLKCKNVFTTHEVMDLTTSLMVELPTGAVEPFLADKLFIEVLLALQDRKDSYTASREVAHTVTKSLLKHNDKPLFTTSLISQKCADVLRRFDKRAYLRYVAEHPSLQA